MQQVVASVEEENTLGNERRHLCMYNLAQEVKSCESLCDVGNRKDQGGSQGGIMGKEVQGEGKAGAK
jgi:hypothetical protein